MCKEEEKTTLGINIPVETKEELQINAIKSKSNVTDIIIGLVRWFNKNPKENYIKIMTD